MAFQQVGPDPILKSTDTLDKKDYYLWYDSVSGDVQLRPAIYIPGVSDIIYQNGGWTPEADKAWPKQPTQVRVNTHIIISLKAQEAWRKAGGYGRAVLHQSYQYSSNNPTTPNQTTWNPSILPPNRGAATGTGTRVSNTASGLFVHDPSTDNYSTFYEYTKYGADGGPHKLFDGATYPEKMHLTSQDYTEISAYAYRPAFANDLFSGNNVLKRGISSLGNKVRRLSSVYLPMPANYTINNKVAWGGDEISALAADAMNNTALLATGGTISTLLGQGPGGAKVVDQIAKSAAILQGGDFGTLAGASFNSMVLQAAGYAVSPEAILARKQGLIPNNNLELLFQGVALRSVQFGYRMTARTPTEANNIRRIIKFFKFNMAAKKKTGNSPGGASFFLGTPNIFQIHFWTKGPGGSMKENPSIGMIKPCALTDFQTNYTPEGFWAAYDLGQPVVVEIACTFQELEPIYDTDYQGNYSPGAPNASNTNISRDRYVTVIPDSANHTSIGW